MNLFPKPPSFSQLTEGLDTWPNWIKDEFQQRAINVKWFGAKGDGVTDDTNAIQAAINAIAEGSIGGTIIFPPGTYIVSKTINITSTVSLLNGRHNIILKGIARGYYSSIIKGITPGMTLFNIQSTGVAFRDITLWGDGGLGHNPNPVPTMIGVVVGDGVRTGIDEFLFENSQCMRLYTGIVIKARNNWVRNSLFNNCKYGIDIQGYSSDIESRDYHIIGNRFHTISDTSIKVSNYAKEVVITNNNIDDSCNGIIFASGCDDVLIANNIFPRNWGESISIDSLKGACRNITIQGNVITGTTTTEDTGNGITIKRSSGNIGPGVLIVGNVIRVKRKNGINLEALATGLVAFNYIEGAGYQGNEGYSGIYVNQGSVIILGNLIRGVGKTQYGITLTNNVFYPYVVNNHIEVVSKAINEPQTSIRGTFMADLPYSYMEYFKETKDNNVPSSGTWRRGDKVWLLNPEAGNYVGYVCTSSGTFGTLTGVTGSINADSTSLTVNDATNLAVGQYINIAGISGERRITAISGNTITIDVPADVTVTDATVSWAAPTLSKFGNINLVGSITWDPPSLDSGSGVTSPNITVNGAAVGDFVIVAPPYNLQEILCTGYVSSENTVVIRLYNDTSSTIDLPSGTWKVKVIKP